MFPFIFGLVETHWDVPTDDTGLPHSSNCPSSWSPNMGPDSRRHERHMEISVFGETGHGTGVESFPNVVAWGT